MKKLLAIITLAATALSAQAEVGVSGNIRYDAVNGGTGTATGITESKIVFSSTEDLGGGNTVSAAIGLDGAARNETVSGVDAQMTLGTKMGALTVGQVELGNGIIGRGLGGAPVIGADGSVLADKGYADIVKYAAPAIGGFTASVSGTRAIDGSAARAYTAGVSGKVLGMDTGVDYNESTKRVRASASTQVGPLTVGAGWSGRETGVADSRVFGASTTFGAVTVGAARSIGNGTANEVGAKYAFSKRTNVQVAMRDVSENSVVANNVKTYRVRMEHAF